MCTKRDVRSVFSKQKCGGGNMGCMYEKELVAQLAGVQGPCRRGPGKKGRLSQGLQDP